ncbi:dihydroorotate dehydrogenase electron transfer subunit [Prevotella intermedia]|uniref:dihydroorotate dehydrogenase electron transfer subunit n=1 Tax=Prevotella intermedia TaxID=28131 RepID=UPI0020065DC5|nr:dihydroorotate dehydrogenase electron transfer subunit [Prevotella intermedia]MCK6144033.1 dihydroorotate dehydrogenase electron transfer subunit [Prevotella intermedia]
MKQKFILELKVVSVERLNEKNVLIKLTHDAELPNMKPGQFVEVRVDGSASTYLRRPISINFVDKERNELWLLVAEVGDGTRTIAAVKPGDTLNCVLPLGNGFTYPASSSDSLLLIGGGVGVAPLLYFGMLCKERGIAVTFLLGARTASDLLELDEFKKYGDVFVTTEDGTMGEKGYVTNHSILHERHFNQISTCGPKPMMVSVAKYARTANIRCEASLENLMACGVGACLCCVEKTTEGNLCVCTEGPVFDVNQLLW